MIYIIHKKKTKIENLINADLDRKSSDDDNESDNETKKWDNNFDNESGE